MKKTYNVNGMHCVSCSRLINLQVKRLEGVQNCEVDFSTKKATVEFDEKKQSSETINTSLTDLGYSFTAI